MPNLSIFGARLARAAGSSLTFYCLLFSGSLAPRALALAEPSYLPPPFACEVRYHFREDFPHAKAGAKKVSAPSHEREGLPLSRAVISDGSAAQIVEGRVRHLPYRFVVKISRTTDADAGTLEVNVLDSSGKPLKGFPTKLPNPLTKTGDTSRKEFEIAVPAARAKKIGRTLLAKRQFLTHVDLVVGLDDDFLSADFPK